MFAEKKSGGGLRLCVDYRTLNANIVINAWPLPHIDYLLSQLKGASIFSSLNLRNGYNKILIDPLIYIKQFLYADICSMSIQLCCLG